MTVTMTMTRQSCSWRVATRLELGRVDTGDAGNGRSPGVDRLQKETELCVAQEVDLEGAKI